MVRTHEVYLSRSEMVRRSCSNCGHSWLAEFKIEAKAEKLWEDDARREAQKKLDQMAKYKRLNVEEQVLCPLCKHFCIEAMKKHFPRDFASGLLQKYRNGQWRALWSGLGLGVVGAALLLFLGPLSVSAEWWQAQFASLEGEEWYAQMFVVLFLLAFVAATYVLPIVSVWLLAKFVKSVVSYGKLARSVRSNSESELQALAVECYHNNKDSLSPRMRWVNTLATCVSNAHSPG